MGLGWITFLCRSVSYLVTMVRFLNWALYTRRFVIGGPYICLMYPGVRLHVVCSMLVVWHLWREKPYSLFSDESDMIAKEDKCLLPTTCFSM